MKREVNYSNWREDLREVVDVPPIEPKTPKTPRREVKENEKVNNIVVINPTMSEANEVFKEIGGTVLDIQETEIPTSSKVLRLLTQKSTIDQKIAQAKTENLNKMKKTNQPQDDTQLEVQERTLTPEEKKKKPTAYDLVKRSMGKSFINTENLPKRQHWSKEHMRKDPTPNRYDNKND